MSEDNSYQGYHAQLLEKLERLECENAALREALTKIRSLTPVNMACDHWSKYYGLEPEQVFDLCDEVLGKEAQP